MRRSEFSVPWLGTVRRSTLVLAVIFLAVLTLYLLVRPAPEIAPTGRTAEPREKADITRSDPAGEAPEPRPKRTATPTSTPRPRTSTPAPVPSASRPPTVLPDPAASGPASPDPLLPLLVPRASKPAPDPSAAPAPSGP